MVSSRSSRQQVQTLVHQLIPSIHEGFLCHTELLITLDKASWHLTRPPTAGSPHCSPVPGAHACAQQEAVITAPANLCQKRGGET